MNTRSAKRFIGAINRTPAKRRDIGSAMDQHVVAVMQRRGIVSGVFNDVDGESHADKVLRVLSEDREWQAEYEAGRAQRAAEQAQAALTLPELLTRTIGGSEGTSSPMPLNGARVIQAVIAGLR